MPAEKNNISIRVLVAPLDWGLGHATRCIPLINLLLKEGFEVFLGGSGDSGKLLAAEFPTLPYQEIPSHRVQYTETKRGFAWAMVRQLPKLFFGQLREERAWLKKFIKIQPLDVIISDNRYGLYHPDTHNILITHQLGLRSGLSKAADRILRGINNRLLKKFNYCWVPDHAEYPNLSGALGHPTWPTPTPVAYIGPLTRFHPSKTPEIPAKLTLVLSGPEPQRSLLEKKCLQELNTWKGRITLIRGLPTKSKSIVAPPSWKVYDHLPSDQLQQEIEEAEVVIARCGYSTLMDLCALNKKAILIPTPGQPEQTYLANWIKEQNLACCIAQDSDLSQLLQDKSTDIPVLNISVNKINNPSILIQSIDQLRSLHR